MRRGTVALLTVVPLALTGCSLGAPQSMTVGALGAAQLRPFDSCEQLLDYYQEQAADLVGPYGFGQGYGAAEGGMATGDEAGGDEAGAAMTGAADTASAGGEHSDTNTQEVGVDEADLVKTDGRIIVTSVNGRVQVVDVASEAVIATIDPPGRGDHAAELLLEGTDLVVLSSEQTGWSNPAADLMPAFAPQRTLITRVDLSDPAAPRTLGSVRVEGGYRSARMVDGSIRLVLVSDPPGLAFQHPTDGSLRAEEEAEEANRAIVEQTVIDDWIPHLQVLDGDGRATGNEPLMPCDQLHQPREFSGLSTLSVLTLDASGDDARPTSTTGVVAGGNTVYASTDRLVVATSPWDVWAWGGWDVAPWDGPDTLTTDLHTFDLSDPGSTAYLASGTVQGRLLNQFALDEQDGVIRVATTTDGNGFDSAAQSSLVVLREEDGELVETGRVDGLGKTEQIYAVRYLSADLAAIVTFRQVDPLYLVSTADPSRPEVLGELKIPGYSAYLHPLPDGRLLGIGQDADPETGSTEGLQASLFDISDPTDPTRIGQLTWPNAHSAVEWDHRAFLFWEATGQFFLPAEAWSEDDEIPFIGVLTATYGGNDLTEGPRASTLPEGQQWSDPVVRSIVIGTDLWALSHQGLYRFDLETMEGGPAVRLG